MLALLWGGGERASGRNFVKGLLVWSELFTVPYLPCNNRV